MNGEVESAKERDLAVELQPWKQPLAKSEVLHMSVVLRKSQELAGREHLAV